ncbi:MAG: molybdopterin-containing oxidoreductase family protein, partial [Coriobacteriales bacterium]|jgi:thiosulfate reductase/polysulfide reductase chain A
MGIGPICWNPRIWMDTMTYGWSVECDFRPDLTQCLVLWGTNPAESDNSLFWANIARYAKDGGKLVVVDTRCTPTAAKATLWLHPFPGTDIVLAYAMARVIIEEDLYDHDFVENWCHGFDEFKQAAFERTLEEASELTTVSVGDIRAAARLYACEGPAGLLSGRGVDQIGPNTAALHRVLAALRALTGNVDVPGGNVLNEAPTFLSELELEGSENLSAESRAHGLNEPDCGIQSYEGYVQADAITAKLGRHLPMRYLTSALPVRVWNAAVTGEPYKVSALIVDGANPLVTYADTRLVKRAFEAMDLIVVLEFIMTPTAQMADYVLPAAAALEHPAFQAMGGVSDFCYGGPAAVEPQFERREDYVILRELALRLGDSEKNWPAHTLSEELARTIAPTGMSWEEFGKLGTCGHAHRYYKHEEIDPETGKPRGFATESGKVELANDFLARRGAGRVAHFTPVPGVHKDVSHDPGCATMITGARKQPYWASSYFEVPRMRKMHPRPTLEMSAATAKNLGVAEGDEVLISRQDEPDVEITQYVHIANMVDGVVSAEYGWWYPEQDAGAPGFSGLFSSNVNLLTRGTVEGPAEPLIGTWIYNGIPCRVRKKG